MQENEQARVTVRAGEAGDFNFIISTWLKSYKHSSYFAKRIRNSIFFHFHHEVVSRIVLAEGTSVFVACDLVDPNVIYGYLVMGTYKEEPIIHYVYVKAAFRKMGIAKSLVGALPAKITKFSFSHWTFVVDSLIDKFPEAVYIPYLI